MLNDLTALLQLIEKGMDVLLDYLQCDILLTSGCSCAYTLATRFQSPFWTRRHSGQIRRR